MIDYGEIPDLGFVPDAEIARRWGVSREAVRQWRGKLGVPALTQRAAAELRYAAIREAAVGCTTLMEAAAKAGCHRTTVRRAGFVGRVGSPGLGADGPTALLSIALDRAGDEGLAFADCLAVAYAAREVPPTGSSVVARTLQRLVSTGRATRTGTHGKHRWHLADATERTAP